MITIAETPPYSRKADKLLSYDEKQELVAYLSANPKSGVLIEGTGGIRKLRWARSSTGKSSGFRIIYYFHNETIPLYLLTLFAKNEKDNISKEEKVMLAKLVKALTSYWSD